MAALKYINKPIFRIGSTFKNTDSCFLKYQVSIDKPFRILDTTYMLNKEGEVYTLHKFYGSKDILVRSYPIHIGNFLG